MDEILTDKTQIKGHIYLITNNNTGKQYVGQTVSHRKNHNKYRPFGFEGRFRDHVSEALCNTKKNQCWYLNNAIRKDGSVAFAVELIQECLVDELNILEVQYIEIYNTLYPNGYNLTLGGKTTKVLKHEFSEEIQLPKQRGGCKFRTQDTRELISKRSKETSNTDEQIKIRSNNAKQQHMKRKLDKFRSSIIDPLNIEKYITIRKSCVIVRVDESVVRFAGKHETREQLKDRAVEFLNILATLPNCSGNPLEP
jgi:hypothetical protein